MSRAWRKGSTRAWRKTRAFVLTRDGHRCQLKLDGCTTVATEAHHTVGRETSGDDPAKLIAVCSHCNKRTGDPRRHNPRPQPRTRW